MTASSLPLDDYKRYGRQMILDGIGLPGTSAQRVHMYHKNHPLIYMHKLTPPQVSSNYSRPLWLLLVLGD
jgi:hypothetical protein